MVGLSLGCSRRSARSKSSGQVSLKLSAWPGTSSGAWPRASTALASSVTAVARRVERLFEQGQAKHLRRLRSPLAAAIDRGPDAAVNVGLLQRVGQRQGQQAADGVVDRRRRSAARSTPAARGSAPRRARAPNRRRARRGASTPTDLRAPWPRAWRRRRVRPSPRIPARRLRTARPTARARPAFASRAPPAPAPPACAPRPCDHPRARTASARRRPRVRRHPRKAQGHRSPQQTVLSSPILEFTASCTFHRSRPASVSRCPAPPALPTRC